MDKINQIDPIKEHNNYMKSQEAIAYGAITGGDAYVLANQVAGGTSDSYEVARRIYEYIEDHFECDQEYEMKKTLIAMLNAKNISTIEVAGTSCDWVFFYCNGKWHAISPYMSSVDNNVGYFDTSIDSTIWDIGKENVYVLTH